VGAVVELAVVALAGMLVGGAMSAARQRRRPAVAVFGASAAVCALVALVVAASHAP